MDDESSETMKKDEVTLVLSSVHSTTADYLVPVSHRGRTVGSGWSVRGYIVGR